MQKSSGAEPVGAGTTETGRKHDGNDGRTRPIKATSSEREPHGLPVAPILLDTGYTVTVHQHSLASIEQSGSSSSSSSLTAAAAAAAAAGSTAAAAASQQQQRKPPRPQHAQHEVKPQSGLCPMPSNGAETQVKTMTEAKGKVSRRRRRRDNAKRKTKARAKSKAKCKAKAQAKAIAAAATGATSVESARGRHEE